MAEYPSLSLRSGDLLCVNCLIANKETQTADSCYLIKPYAGSCVRRLHNTTCNVCKQK